MSKFGPLFWISAIMTVALGLNKDYLDDRKMRQAVEQEVTKQLKEEKEEEKA